MKHQVRSAFLALALTFSSVAVAQERKSLEQLLSPAMKWRLVGPFRGGRSLAAAGSKARPQEYYFGATGGGIWKTTNGGVDWANVSDGYLKSSSVGALAISESKPDVVYAGMGEKDVRGNISHGDGVYRTSDAGKTWQHLGLAATQNVSRIVVHPTNPDLVYVGALGPVYLPRNLENGKVRGSDARGLYRSADGGKTWDRILFRSDTAGVIDVELDPSDSNTIYAATWEMYRTPYTLNSGGPGSGLFKSTDAGKTWKEITRNPGLPKGLIGKIGITVSPANPKRLWAIVEALEGGIFRSDDAGATWQLVNDNRNWRQRAWYYSHVVADPQKADTVYVLNVGMGRSDDGGKTFTGVGTPHSDNHDLWIAPEDPRRMINANDGGANVSMDGGRTWTEQDIPTAQFYHVTTDNAFPYRIYGAQQDNSTIRIASRTEGFGIRNTDWESTAGGESGYIAVKPNDPDLVFGGSYGGYLEMLNHRTKQSRNINPWPDNPMGHGAIDLAERFQWTFPIVFSPHDPNLLYTSSQHLFKSTNGGESWKKISPDLTRNDPRTLGPSGGEITKDNTSVEYYATIFTVAESPLKPGVIWCGSDDGLIHVSQDAGGSWKNVTPQQMPKWGLVSLIEASPHDEATAYAAVDNHENGDYTPYIYRTNDYGQSWQLIIGGIPETTFVRAVREDPVRKGMLYAGTETGVYVSLNHGASWEPLQINLPVTPIHDLVVKEGDLVVATHGRSFWVLDDLSPLRQTNRTLPDVTLFKPADASRVSWGGGGFRGPTGAGSFGENAPSGVLVTYHLAQKVESPKLEFLDSTGNVFMTMSGQRVPSEPGTHRVPVQLRYPSFRGFSGMILWGAGRGTIAAPPGEYRVRLTAGGKTMTHTFRLLNDPRSTATDADLQAQFDLTMRIIDRVNAANDTVVKIRDIKTKIDAAAKDTKRKDVVRMGEELKAKLSAVEEELYQVRNRSGQDPLNYPIKLNNRLAGLIGVVQSGNFRPTDQSYEVFARLSKELEVHLARYAELERRDLAALNARLKSEGKPEIVPVDPTKVEAGPAIPGGPPPTG